MIDFLSLIRHHFIFLIDQFGFTMRFSRIESELFGNAIIRYESSKVGIDVVLDRGQIFIYLGPLTEPEDDWYDLCDVVSYFAPELGQVYLFPENLTADESITYQVKRLADLLKSYCYGILQGDFTLGNYYRSEQENRAKKFKEEMKRRYPQLKDLE